MKHCIFVLLLLSGAAIASGDRITQSNDNNNMTTGSVVTEGSTGLGFGRSSFDVDIRDCRESTAWDTILLGKQTVRLNPWCAALWYDAKGLHHMAAVMRCDIPEIAQHFPDAEHCIVANKMARRIDPVDDVAVAQKMIDDYEEDRDNEMAELEQRIVEVEKRRARPKPQVTQYGITDEQRVELAKVFEE